MLKAIKEKHLIKKAKSLYKDFENIREDTSPAEENDIIRWWAEELKLDKFFKLIKESENETFDIEKKSFIPEELIEQIENDPYELNVDRSFEDQEMKKSLILKRIRV